MAEMHDIEVVLCHGGSKQSAKIAERTLTAYGARQDYTIYAQPYFIDFNWKKRVTPARWARYMALIQRWQPRVAMAPDFECWSQWHALKQQIVDIRRAGARYVMVTPKFGDALTRIPFWRDFVIGVSVPTSYAGFLPHPDEVVGRKLHFLGGTPDQWVYLRRVYEDAGAKLVSVDGNFAFRQARDYGKYWSANRGGFVEMRGENIPTYALQIASVENTKEYLKNPPPPAALVGNARVQICVKALHPQPMLL